MNFVNFTGLVAYLALTACSSVSKEPDADDSMIAHLSNSQRKEIDEARAEHDRRSDALAVARESVVRAKAEWTVAKKDLDLAEAGVNKAEAVVAVAETGTAKELEEARERLRVAQAGVAPQRELIRWRECEVARCVKAETVAEREQALAEARVGLAKARAFVKTDQAASRHVDVVQHETQVREAQKQVELAGVELEAATRECAVAKSTYDDARARSKKK